MALQNLIARSNEVVLSSTTVDLLIALLVLVLTSLLAIGALFVLRRYRRSKKEAGLPLYNDHLAPNKSNQRRLTLTSSRGLLSKSTFVQSEKQELLSSTSSPPPSPLPEIRITFPEEVDDAGKTQSGRVVVVHVGEKGDIGLEPFEEHLPAYQRGASERFHSLDMERIGGLKEKA